MTPPSCSTHITEAFSHGHNQEMTFTDFLQYPHDSNLSINIIIKILHSLARSNGNKLPQIFYLQADNCFRENKNKYMLAFCELLVHMNVFKEVHLSFLLVGHTHEDIDAMFSRIAHTLRKTDAETMPCLTSFLKDNKQLHGLFDIRSWLTPHLVHTIKGHTKPHHFKFLKNENGVVSLFYRNRCKSPWLTSEQTLFRRLNDGTLSLPIGQPEVLLANMDKINIEGMQRNLPSWQSLFTDQKNDEELKWWQTHIERLKKLKECDNERRLYSENGADWLLPLLPKYSEIEEESDGEGQAVPDKIIHMVNAEMANPEVWQ